MLQAHVVVPLLPLIFPVMWIVINCFGAARIQALFKTKVSQVSKKVSLPLSDVNYHFWEIFKGESDTLSRTANLLHTLGTISVLCCVNKDGILASPNPNAEKVFFFRKRKERRHKKVELRSSQRGGDEDRENVSTENIVDDEHEPSSSPIFHMDVHLLEPPVEDETEHSGIPTPQLNQKDYAFVSHSEVLNLSCNPEVGSNLKFVISCQFTEVDVKLEDLEMPVKSKVVYLNVLLNLFFQGTSASKYLQSTSSFLQFQSAH